MASLRFALLLVVALALAAPSAAAADASGQLEAGALRLADGSAMRSAGLDLATSGETVATLALDLTDVALQRIGTTTVRNGDEGSPQSVSYDLRQINERATYPTAQVSLVQGAGAQIFVLRSLGPASATLDAPTVRGVGGVLIGQMELDGTADPTSEARCELATCIDAFGVYQLAADTLAQLGPGDITLLLYGPTLRVHADGADTDYASGVGEVQEAGSVRTIEDTWIFVRATNVAGTFAAANALLYSSAPTIETTHAAFEVADGDVRVGAVQYRARGDDVTAEGALLLTLGAVAPAPSHGDPRTGEPLYASSFSTRVGGDVASIDLAGSIAYLSTPAQRAGAAAVLAAMAAAVAYGWQHIAFAGAALYTRLSKPDILENDVRSHIYDIIRQTPGISAREVHRRSTQSWGTVVYHLRQLERHHLVVSRALGRTRNYYENHGKYRGMEVQLACLQSDRARVLARAVVDVPGITQEQLALASGFPQPTTSYYVRKLKLAGLVEERRDGRYAKYLPHEDLPRYLEMSEADAPSTGVAVGGVQA